MRQAIAIVCVLIAKLPSQLPLRSKQRCVARGKLQSASSLDQGFKPDAHCLAATPLTARTRLAGVVPGRSCTVAQRCLREVPASEAQIPEWIAAAEPRQHLQQLPEEQCVAALPPLQAGAVEHIADEDNEEARQAKAPAARLLLQGGKDGKTSGKNTTLYAKQDQLARRLHCTFFFCGVFKHSRLALSRALLSLLLIGQRLTPGFPPHLQVLVSVTSTFSLFNSPV